MEENLNNDENLKKKRKNIVLAIIAGIAFVLGMFIVIKVYNTNSK